MKQVFLYLLLAFSSLVLYAQDKPDPYKHIVPGETDDNNAVSVAAGIVNNEVVVKVRIHPGYHIYAFVAETDPFVQTNLKINMPAGYSTVGDLKKPSFKYYSESGTTIYEDEVMFKQEIRGNGKGEITLTISYQCCDSHTCFPPDEKTLKLSL